MRNEVNKNIILWWFSVHMKKIISFFQSKLFRNNQDQLWKEDIVEEDHTKNQDNHTMVEYKPSLVDVFLKNNSYAIFDNKSILTHNKDHYERAVLELLSLKKYYSTNFWKWLRPLINNIKTTLLEYNMLNNNKWIETLYRKFSVNQDYHNIPHRRIHNYVDDPKDILINNLIIESLFNLIFCELLSQIMWYSDTQQEYQQSNNIIIIHNIPYHIYVSTLWEDLQWTDIILQWNNQTISIDISTNKITGSKKIWVQYNHGIVLNYKEYKGKIKHFINLYIRHLIEEDSLKPNIIKILWVSSIVSLQQLITQLIISTQNNTPSDWYQRTDSNVSNDLS